MQAFVLIGSSQSQQLYLDSFQKEHKIPSYFVTHFDPFKIADARTVQKLISFKLKATENRIIEILNPTQEAQNAILKTLEELPDYVFVFFLVKGKDDLLSTILSRAQIINVGEPMSRPHGQAQELLPKTEVTLDDIEKTILILRETVLQQIASKSKDPSSAFFALKQLEKNYKLAKTNNINRRMVLENSLRH